MKPSQQLFLPLVLFFVNISVAQTTAIPDENFEQALIDMNIDSDGTINGQVLTSDIDDVIELDFENYYTGTIIDLTGIEDFTSLEILDFFYIGVSLDETQANVFSNNTNLRELSIRNSCGDCGGSNIFILDLSGLPALESVDLTNVAVQSIKINNPDFDLTNLTLDLYHEGFGGGWTNQICIEVDDPQAATNNDPPYNTWNIITNNTTTNYSFGLNCTLSVNEHEALNTLSVYPNPVQDKFNIENPQQINLDEAVIFDMTGKKVKSFSSFDEAINLERLEQGVYFVRLIQGNTSKTVRVIKK